MLKPNLKLHENWLHVEKGLIRAVKKATKCEKICARNKVFQSDCEWKAKLANEF